MVKAITALTQEQKDAIPEHAEKWIKFGTATGEPDWDMFEKGARKCYEFAGIPWPGRIVRVPNPVVGAFAYPIAVRLSRDYDSGRTRNEICRATRDAVRLQVADHTANRTIDQLNYDLNAHLNGIASAVYHTVYNQKNAVAEGPTLDNARNKIEHDVKMQITDAVRKVVELRGVDEADEVYRAVNNQIVGISVPAIHSVERLIYETTAHHASSWYQYCEGQWAAAYIGWLAFFRDVCELELPGDLWERHEAYTQANCAGWWWPHTQFVMVSDRPRKMCFERNHAPNNWRTRQLHHPTGPALSWEGWDVYSWHGTLVPQDLIEGDGWTAKRIAAEEDAEIQLAAIEKQGWPNLVKESQFGQVGKTVPDPGNPGGELALYEVPFELWDDYAKVLICRNGTPEDDGSYRTFGITVPEDITDPVAAAAWTYDDPDDPTGFRVTPELYAQLARRT